MKASQKDIDLIGKYGGKARAPGLPKRESKPKPPEPVIDPAVKALEAATAQMSQTTAQTALTVSQLVNSAASSQTHVVLTFERILQDILDKQPVPFTAKVNRVGGKIDSVDFHPIESEL